MMEGVLQQQQGEDSNVLAARLAVLAGRHSEHTRPQSVRNFPC